MQPYSEKDTKLKNLSRSFPPDTSVSLISSTQDQFSIPRYDNGESHFDRVAQTIKKVSPSSSISSLKDANKTNLTPDAVHMTNLTNPKILDHIASVSTTPPTSPQQKNFEKILPQNTRTQIREAVNSTTTRTPNRQTTTTFNKPSLEGQRR